MQHLPGELESLKRQHQALSFEHQALQHDTASWRDAAIAAQTALQQSYETNSKQAEEYTALQQKFEATHSISAQQPIEGSEHEALQRKHEALSLECAGLKKALALQQDNGSAPLKEHGALKQLYDALKQETRDMATSLKQDHHSERDEGLLKEQIGRLHQEYSLLNRRLVGFQTNESQDSIEIQLPSPRPSNLNREAVGAQSPGLSQSLAQTSPLKKQTLPMPKRTSSLVDPSSPSKTSSASPTRKAVTNAVVFSPIQAALTSPRRSTPERIASPRPFRTSGSSSQFQKPATSPMRTSALSSGVLSANSSINSGSPRQATILHVDTPKKVDLTAIRPAVLSPGASRGTTPVRLLSRGSTPSPPGVRVGEMKATSKALDATTMSLVMRGESHSAVLPLPSSLKSSATASPNVPVEAYSLGPPGRARRSPSRTSTPNASPVASTPTIATKSVPLSQPVASLQYTAINQTLDMLSNKMLFEEQIKPYFDRIADCTGGRLDYPGALRFFADAGTGLLGAEVGPRDLTEAKYMRFDFDGGGTLSFKEAAKCFRYTLLEVQRKLGGKAAVPVPVKTPERAGYEVLKILSSGGQGSTALANSPQGRVALKIYDKSNQNAGGIEELRFEMEAMKSMEACPHIMRCLEIFQDAQQFYCVNELLPGGDLAGLRQNVNKSGVALTEAYLQSIFKQAISALDYMHRHAMMHCDIKEPNIMLKSVDYANPQIALIDFGLAQCSAGDGVSGGTPGYIPPETLETSIWFPRGDIFSMGVVFFQIMADKTPSETTGKGGLFTEGATTMHEVVEFTKLRQPPWYLIRYQYPGVMPWLPKMLEKDLRHRPKAPMLLQDSWFLGCYSFSE